MKVIKKISSIHVGSISEEVYCRLIALLDLKPNRANYVLPDFELEEGDPRLVLAEELLAASGLRAEPGYSEGPIDWDVFYKEREMRYTYRMRKMYEYSDLAYFHYALVDPPLGLIDCSIVGQTPQFQIETDEISLLMDSSSGREIVRYDLGVALRNRMGEEGIFTDVIIKNSDGGLVDDHYVWIKPKHVMPAMSMTRNSFYDFEGRPCVYGNESGFAVFKGNYDFPEFVYHREDFPQAGV